MTTRDNGESLAALAGAACEELKQVFDGVAPGAIDTAAEPLLRAKRIALHGVGREGLMMRALTMRLYHLGLDAHEVGAMTTPPLAAGDLLVTSAGPGHFSTVAALMTVARDAGAQRLLFTSTPDASLADLADAVVVLPARTMAVDAAAGPAPVLPMGSAYEGAQYLFFELLVRALRERLGIDEAAMRERHTNLE
jgi:6-phospho-3-hexuloisomerase